MEEYKKKIRIYFSKKAKIIEYAVGDLVLQDTKASDPTNTGKLQPNWEGPYTIKEELCLGTYKLSYLDDTEVPKLGMGSVSGNFISKIIKVHAPEPPLK